jgi:hypothetical protein
LCVFRAASTDEINHTSDEQKQHQLLLYQQQEQQHALYCALSRARAATIRYSPEKQLKVQLSDITFWQNAASTVAGGRFTVAKSNL